MLRAVNELNGSTINASDGEIGSIREAYFDDEAWTIRYLVVDAGSWLARRDVLISPYSVKQPLGSGKIIDVALTREQVKMSPDIDTHKPVSRQHERDTLGYYGHPMYWLGGGLWAMGAYPMVPPLAPPFAENGSGAREMQEAAARRQQVPEEDLHLRSTDKVTGYDIQATDDSIGQVTDFLFDDESWTIRYLVVDTSHWWSSGKKVLIPTDRIERIDWTESKVFTDLSRDAVKASPEYNDGMPLDSDYETRLHESYDRQRHFA